ncbi:MAG: putative ABC transporter permease [Bacillota bacterium]|nr:putative ABC transporter permease [Bacillota bacterium]
MYEMIFLFMVYSIIGWCWETSFVSISQRKLINRGFLYGPYIPIYGFGVVVIVSSMNFLADFIDFNSVWTISIAIIYISIIASVWEYIVSYSLELLFNTHWWDYSYKRFNLHGRIAIDYSIGWGIGGYILWMYANRYILIFMHALSDTKLEVYLAIFYTIFIIDSFVTIRELITLRTITNKLSEISSELGDFATYSVDVLNEGISNSKTKLKNRVLYLRKKAEVTLSENQQNLLDHYNSLLVKSINVSRFYITYPKASSRTFTKIIKILRYKKRNKQ